MQCQSCDKAATVHLTEIIEGKKLERHLCEQCAQKEGVTIKAHLPISELLNNLVDSHSLTRQLSDLRCPQCDITWEEFRKCALLGCPNDYIAFEEPLGILIEKAQDGATRHVGRVPRRSSGAFSGQVKLLRLRQDLQSAVEKEDYEIAARLRDEISKISTN